ncbi:MAG TPA: response regulator, partial [Candidatus Limnocylindrales bacterium]|nr:response regulator [Candidatus Limnocylindrales bacterium]
GNFDVPLRILFADDSMTAQNMGKKILSEAGYDVVAVSNGAAAVKKIAEQKPDIIILDVYMPGYSGLEVCEKVRGSLETMKTPVLLTVGKMEPYKPEDANRVKADGVIIKPFEASDLLAIIKKFEERIAQMPVPPMVAQAVRAEVQYQEDTSAAVEHMDQRSMGKASSQPMVEVPDHMAGAAAFNDMLGADSSIGPQHFGVSSPAATFETSVIVPAPPIPTADYELPGSWKEEVRPEHAAVSPTAEPEPEITATPVEVAPDPVVAEAEPETVAMEPLADQETNAMPAEASEAVSAAAEPAHPQFIPVYKEPEPQPQAASYEVLPTAAPPIGDIEIPREPELQETADETTRATVADRIEPGLLSTFESEPEAERKSAGAEPPASWPSSNSPSALAQEAPAAGEQSPINAATAEVSDADFEARVAAAMAAYSHATAPVEVHESPVVAPVEIQPEPPADAVPVAETKPVEEAVPSFEYSPPVRIAEPVEMAHGTSFESTATVLESIDPVSAPAHEAVTHQVHEAVTSGVEAAAVAAATETGAEHHNIAQAVHRVMERLKPELVEEIMRELRSKK